MCFECAMSKEMYIFIHKLTYVYKVKMSLGHSLYSQLSLETSSSFFDEESLSKGIRPEQMCVFRSIESLLQSCKLSLQVFNAPLHISHVICMHFVECINSIARHIMWTLIHSSPTKNKHVRTNMSKIPKKVLEVLIAMLKMCMLISYKQECLTVETL